MDEKSGEGTLAEAIVKEARRDVFNSVGRVYIGTLREALNVTIEEIFEALKALQYRYRIWPMIDDPHSMILVYFEEREYAPSDLQRNVRGRR